LFQSNEPQPLETLVTAHVSVALALADDGAAATATERGEPAPTNPLWQEDAGVATKALLEGLTRPDLPAPAIAAADYPDFYRALVVAETVRPQVPRHPRLFIWGPLEARLQQPDVVVLGSLNDGTWPEAADPGPWLNRPMRAAMKLPAPEEKLGYAAHDFTMALGAERVFLTRAEKIDGVPTVPSRWLMRLEALLGGIGAAETLRRPCAGVDGGPATYLGWARQRDDGGPVTPVERPAPRPPVDARPRRLSVSAVETWIANPYAIYAGHILRLEALPCLGAAPDASVRGGLLHEALARFVKAHPAALPADIEAALMRHAGDVFTDWAGHPRVAAFWLPRLARFANWFADTEPQRRAGIATVMAEMSGQMQLGSPERRFTLTARADRLDVRDDGGLVITDYKTGTPPKEKEVIAGRRPQLPLEAAIALAGGFAKLAPSVIAGLRYIRASGGERPGEETMLKAPDLAGLVNTTLAGLERHIARFDDPDTPYLVTRRKRFSYDFDPFAQLARVAEWSGTAEADAEIEDIG
jgi:ATP-dependent helicase/nuclease subunit B